MVCTPPRLAPSSCAPLVIAGLLCAAGLFVLPVSVSAQTAGGGGSHTTVLKDDGTVWSWGANGNGQLGDGSTTSRVLPTNVATLSNVVGIADGDTHVVAVKSDGTVWAWGLNGSGQLGDGTTTQRTTPVQIPTLSDVIAVAAGTAHSVALKSDGTVWAWGLNSNGQLGDGTTTPRTSPVQVTGLSGITSIASGSYHVLAVKNDGTLWAWGRNGNGQLGDNTTTQRPSPVQVSGLSNIVQAAGGAYHSLARKSDGTVKAWGYNGYGQLGDSTTTQRTAPVAVVSIPAAASIAAGAYHSFAAGQDLSVWGWGNNDDGQLGDGTTIRQPIAVAVTNVSNITHVAGGLVHSVAIASDGTVWAWGQNADAQVGDGTTVKRLAPVRISEAAYAWKVGTPTFNIPAGTYQAALNVTVATATPGATIHYTTTGVEPTEADATVASGSTVSITQSATLRAKAWKNGIPSSNVDGLSYVLRVFVTALSPGSGTYAVHQNVTVSTTASGATLHYTTTGADPTESDPVVTSGGTVAVTQSLTLKVKGWKTGWTTSDTVTGVYTMKVGAPSLSPAPGVFTSAQTVTVSDVTPSATLNYTTNGAEPTASDPIVAAGGTISIGTVTTLRIKGWRVGWTTSDTTVATYRFNLGTVATPVLTAPGGLYTSLQAVALSTTTGGATIRYTLDGTDPTLLSRVYTAPILVEHPLTVKARAFKADWTSSAVASGTYTFDFGTVDIPTLSPPGGQYATTQTVTVATTTAGATIHYTTTGLDPTEADPTVASGGTVTVAQSWRLKAKAWKTGTPASAVRTADYWITGAVAAGAYHTLALKSNGTVWSWGFNNAGQLGDGTTTLRTAPVQVSTITDAVAVAGGLHHSLALRRDGTVWAWGANASGQLGDGTTTPRTTPVPVATLTNVIAIAAGDTHSLVIKNDGTLWAWGSNNAGQLGDGTTSMSLNPIPITTMTGVAAIAASTNFSMALKTDGAPTGTVWTWGRGIEGQLGDGVTGLVNRVLPANVLVNTVAIGAGSSHAVAVLADGTGRAWGTNSDGRLGDGTVTGQFAPVTIVDLANAVAIDGGGVQSAATTADGSAWAWGDGGHVGLENIASSNLISVPVRVPGAGTDVVRLSAGADHTVVARRDGSVWTWGFNLYGQFGAGSTAGSDIPVKVPNFSLVDESWLLGDPDGDGLSTWRELQVGTDPRNPDTNGDGLRDGAAVSSGVSATSTDTDGDGVSNAVELARGTDPFRADTDSDGVPDLADCFPLDPTRALCPAGDPDDHTPPVITLQYPTNAVLVP